jgi:general secretion pathway protein E
MNAVVNNPAPWELLESTVTAALDDSARDGRPVLKVLAEQCGVSAPDLAQALARMFDYRCLDSQQLQRFVPNFEHLSTADAAQRKCLLARDGQQLWALIADPFDATLRPWLEAREPEALQWAMVTPDDIAMLITRHEQGTRAMDMVLPEAQTTDELNHDVENLTLTSINADSSPVVRLVHSTVYDALRTGASDVHMESTGAGLTIRYRIDGVLSVVGTANGADVAEQVISRIKVMSDLDIGERRVPQDGRFKIAIDRRPIDFRVSIIPSVFGEDAVLRVLDKQAVTDHADGLKLETLGFDPRMVSQLLRLASRPHGMFLVTGPTGSGKTTTLYAAISETNTGKDKIVTIEDPVEYQLAGVLQIPVNEKKGLTFARGLRSILRHDPDKIMVGEIRDSETAQIAIQSALTGHLVFTTVHANNVFDVLSRFTHMGVDPYSFTSALNGILAQRLVRVLCTHCAESYTPTRESLAESGISVAEAENFTFRIGRGCRQCRGSGYRGRKAVGELMILNDELREAIVARAPVRQLKELASRSGVRLIRNAALELVVRGETTLEEVNRVTAMA